MMTMVTPFGIVNVTQRKKIITLMGHPYQKKEAKKDSAFRMLFYVLGMEGE